MPLKLPQVRLVGWDIGGAHLKCAAFDDAGELLAVRQLACPLWQGLSELDRAYDLIAADWGLTEARHVVTMTGELCDLFPSREAGVRAIVAAMAARVGEDHLRIYARQAGLVRPTAVVASDVASMNWHATATALAQRCDEALLIDTGSTTTDVIRIEKGRVVTQGHADRTRLMSDELVYQGVVRTPVMAVSARVMYAGQWQGIAAEYFANMADVYRLTGELPPDADLLPSADGRGKTLGESAARLARMVGDDAGEASFSALQALARELAAAQIRRLGEAVQRVEQGRGAPLQMVVGAGVGRFLVQAWARASGRTYRDFSQVLGLPGALAEPASVCAPAVAVGCLGRSLIWA